VIGRCLGWRWVYLWPVALWVALAYALVLAYGWLDGKLRREGL
jgi:hypothetical protein